MVWKSCVDPPNSLKSKYYFSTLLKKVGGGEERQKGEKKADWE